MNNSLAAEGATDPLLRRRAKEEITQIRRVADYSERIFVVPRLGEEPRGAAGLRAMIAPPATAARSVA